MRSERRGAGASARVLCRSPSQKAKDFSVSSFGIRMISAPVFAMIFVYCIYVSYLCICCSSLIQFPYFIERRDAHVIIIFCNFPDFSHDTIEFFDKLRAGYAASARARQHTSHTHTVQRECRSQRQVIRCVMCEMSFWKSTANRDDEMAECAARHAISLFKILANDKRRHRCQVHTHTGCTN